MEAGNRVCGRNSAAVRSLFLLIYLLMCVLVCIYLSIYPHARAHRLPFSIPQQFNPPPPPPPGGAARELRSMMIHAYRAPASDPFNAENTAFALYLSDGRVNPIGDILLSVRFLSLHRTPLPCSTAVPSATPPPPPPPPAGAACELLSMMKHAYRAPASDLFNDENTASVLISL